MDAVWHTLQEGSPLVRVYAPEPYGSTALGFRRHGPHNRFDHQRAAPDGRARTDEERGVLYAGKDIVCCLGEFFADSREITVPGTRVAAISVVEPVCLLDLRGTAATGVGTTQAIAAVSQRRTTQAWARYWYDHPELASAAGLLYAASNSGIDACAFWERAEGAFRTLVDLELGDASLEDELEFAAAALHWPIAR